jgi:flagellar protein FlaG
MNIQSVTSLGQTTTPEPRAAGVAPARAPAEVQTRPEPTPQQVRDAVRHINFELKTARNTALEFSVAPGTDATIVKVVDTESGELIRQIPSEAALAIAESIDSFQKGLLLGQEA